MAYEVTRRSPFSASLMLTGLMAATAGIGGCTELKINTPGLSDRSYFGYVRVVSAQNVDKKWRGVRWDLESVGLRIDRGVTVGYVNENQVAVPLDCFIVFLVKDAAQLDEVLQKNRHLMEASRICVAQDTR